MRRKRSPTDLVPRKLLKTDLLVAGMILIVALTSCGPHERNSGNDMEAMPIHDESHGDTMGDEHVSHINPDDFETGVEVIHGPMTISGIWSRPALKGGSGAVYLKLVNNGSQVEKLLRATSDIAQAVEIHQIRIDDDVMSMAPVSGGVEISAAGELTFSPGGYHLMLINLQSDLTEGGHFPVTLHFLHSGQIRVESIVARP